MRKYSREIKYSLLSALIVLAVWYAVAYWVGYTRGSLFPTPHHTLIRLLDLLGGESLYGQPLYQHIAASLVRWSTGFVLAAAIGIALGIGLGTSGALHRSVMPAVYGVQLIPGLAWIPIALLIFGLGDTSTIFMIFATAVPPVIINTAGGIRSVPNIYVRAAKMLGSDRLTLFFRVMLPASALSLINGLRIGLANGWRVLIAAEMIVGVGLGLGYSIIQARWSLDFTAAFVSIIVIATIGLVIERIVFDVVEKRVSDRMGLETD